MGSTLLRIRFYKIDGFIKIYNGIKYLVSFNNHFKNNEICAYELKKWYER